MNEQGYHDIMSILLLVLGDLELAKACAEKMSLHRLRDSMGPGLDPVLGYLRCDAFDELCMNCPSASGRIIKNLLCQSVRLGKRQNVVPKCREEPVV